ncbi:beta-galactosidase trimerization domain-containing protein [Candidatus Poribacteria bacterium]
MDKSWYQKAYRRSVIDMHITDWDERFMSRFDAQEYLDMLTLAQVQSAVVYAHSHVGLCYFPTKVGKMHSGLKGRNILGEVIDLCHKNDIAVSVYASLIYDTWAYRNNPDWKIIDLNGNPVSERSRYGVCCPNSPYRNYIVSLAEEICTNFDFEGIRFDMTFWPNICYCPHCQKRFAREVGGELPKVINWEDPNWVAFQRKREEWLVDFAALLTSTVKKLKPDASVEHQASTYHTTWRLGVTHKLAEQNDFLEGDFYGDALQGSFARKLFYNLSKNLPCGFETCISVDLGNYTTLKTRDLLKAKVCASLADAAAFIFIDSIDPVGTLNPAVYKRMGSIFNETKAYDQYAKEKLCQDVAVYLSTESKCDFADNGKSVGADSGGTPHVDAAVSACGSLITNHIPFGVITKKNINDLLDYPIVVLPNVLMMDDEEVKALREYVRAGGCLYASRGTSLVTKDGRRQEDFMLADVFGVSYKGETNERFTYIAPAQGSERLFEGYTIEHPLGSYVSHLVVDAGPDTKVLGKVILPYSDPADPIHYASIHNNPPGIKTDHPAVILNEFGAGKAIYATCELEKFDSHRDLFISLIRLISKPFTFEADAPKAVEITLRYQEDKHRFIISLINFQRELPNIPVDGIKVRIRLDGRTPKRLLVLPEEKELTHEIKDGYLQFIAPRLETLCMFALDCK